MKKIIIAIMALGLTQLASADDASIEKGKGIYMGVGACFSCHGATGKGDGPAAIALNPKPRSFAEGAFLYDTDKDGKKGTREDLKNIMKNGTIKYGGSPLMPPRPDIAGADLEALIDYVLSLGPKTDAEE